MPSDPKTREEAWIGDAVLALFARSWILEHVPEKARSEVFVHLTSNQFLAALGDPTRVEAGIGRVYAKEGLQPAFDYIQTQIAPSLFAQWNKKQRGRRDERLFLRLDLPEAKVT